MHSARLLQVPVMPVFSGAVLHIAGFLSQNLPPSLDTIVPPTYVRQVRGPPVQRAAITSLAATGTFSSSCFLYVLKVLRVVHAATALCLLCRLWL